MRTPKFETPVGPLLTTVFESILQVFLLCCAGYILAGRGVLDKKTQKQLNKLNVSLFTPSLLFSKVAFFLSPDKLRELWIIPIFFIVVTILSMAVSWVLGYLFKLRRSQRNFAMAASMFMNSNSLPIALMQSLVVTVPHLKWTDDDNRDAMVGRALTYLVLYSTLGMVLRWSYGVRLLAQADEEPEQEVPAPEQEEEETEASLLLADSQATLPTPRLVSSPDQQDGGHFNGYLPDIVVQDVDHNRPRPHRKTTYFRSFPNSPNQSRVHLPSEAPTPGDVSPSQTPSSDIDEDADPSELPSYTHRTPSIPTNTPFQSFLRRSRRRIVRFWIGFNEFMTVPLWAALLSLIVACVQPLQHALDAHMEPVKGALNQAGNCSIPLTLIVLGAYFYKAPDTPEEAAQKLRASKSSGSLFEQVKNALNLRAKWRQHKRKNSSVSSIGGAAKPASRTGETKTVVIAILSRMVIVPLLLMPLMAISTWYDWHEVFEDPVFVVSNVLLISSPPALTLAQITQAAASGDAFERLISRTIFWSYCVVTPPATIIYVVIGMLLAKL